MTELTKRKGAILGMIIGSMLFAFFKIVQVYPNITDLQLRYANVIFFIAQIAFVIGMGIGFGSFFRKHNKSILGNAGNDGLILGLSLAFDIISIPVAILSGQPIIPK